jgi:predicted Mrr-cat superfamily restriction endonuclease
MPYPNNIAIGKVISLNKYDKNKYDDDRANYYQVEWIVKSYPRNELNSDFQTTLKYKATILDISYYINKIETILENQKKGIFGLRDEYTMLSSKQRNEDILDIYKHINNRGNIKFQDTDFEYFILDLLKIAYNLEGEKNSVQNEAIDGRDLILYLNYNEIGISVQWNVQVKQHSNITDSYSIEQILRSKSSETEINVVVTNADFETSEKQFAQKNNVILITGRILASLIYDNFEKLSDKYPDYLAKLGLIKKISII